MLFKLLFEFGRLLYNPLKLLLRDGLQNARFNGFDAVQAWLVRKLSMEETLSPSKKNWVVISLPSLFTQVRRQPFSIKNIVLEIFPSCNRMVLAGASTCLKKGEKIVQGSLLFNSKSHSFRS